MGEISDKAGNVGIGISGGGPRGGAAEERRLELMELLEILDLPERVEEGPASEDLWPMSRQSELW